MQQNRSPLYTIRRLTQAVETGIFDMAHSSPLVTHTPQFRNVKSRCLSYSHPLANIIGAARLDTRSADAAISAITTYFSSRQHAFSWRIGPNSSPADLGVRLIEHDFEIGPRIIGMVLSWEEVTGIAFGEFFIRSANRDDIGLLGRLIERAFPLPAELAGILGGLFLGLATGGAFSLYLAFTPSGEICVGFGTTYFSDEAVAVFPGAAVLPEYRRQGIYRQMLQHRLNEAVRRGCKYIVVQAVAETSAPICRQMNFEELCSIDTYVWCPR